MDNRDSIAGTVLPEQAVILLAEDRPDDVELVERALKRAKVFNPVLIVRDGEEVLTYLDGCGKYEDRKLYPLPNVLLLDLKMPKLDGFEVLREIGKRPHLKAIRVLVLTSSEDIYDLHRAYQLGAHSFLVKPNDFEDFSNLMASLNAFWLGSNRLASTATPVTSTIPAAA